jgi:hypothetical protein
MPELSGRNTRNKKQPDAFKGVRLLIEVSTVQESGFVET